MFFGFNIKVSNMRKNVFIILIYLFLTGIIGCSLNSDVTRNIENPFFPYSEDVTELEFEGTVLFEEEENISGTVLVSKVKSFDEGSVFKIEIKNGKIDLGSRSTIYFYVTEDKIWKLNIREEKDFDELKTEKDFEEYGCLILSDDLSDVQPSGSGFYSNDLRTYTYSYSNNSVDTGYFEKIILKNGKGIVHYMSGFGALRDYIEINIA